MKFTAMKNAPQTMKSKCLPPARSLKSGLVCYTHTIQISPEFLNLGVLSQKGVVEGEGHSVPTHSFVLPASMQK